MSSAVVRSSYDTRRGGNHAAEDRYVEFLSSIRHIINFNNLEPRARIVDSKRDVDTTCIEGLQKKPICRQGS
jgi:hypothetical protein